MGYNVLSGNVLLPGQLLADGQVSSSAFVGDGKELEHVLKITSNPDQYNLTTIGSDAYRLTGLYQWVWNIDGGFNWYAGAGGGIAQVNFNDVPIGIDDSETYVYAAGDIGIEYDFDIPLLISLDFRPEFGFSNVLDDDIDFDIAFGIRYQF